MPQAPPPPKPVAGGGAAAGAGPLRTAFRLLLAATVAMGGAVDLLPLRGCWNTRQFVSGGRAAYFDTLARG